MSTAPSGKSVARIRYWLIAAVKLYCLGLMVWNAAAVFLYIAGLLMSFLTGGEGVGLAGEVSNFWNATSASLLWLTIGVVGFTAAPRAAQMILPPVGAHCSKCGYSRRGLVSNTPCPECGARPEVQGA